MTGQFAEVVLVENEGLVSFGFTLGIIRTEINVNLISLGEDLVNPFFSSLNIAVRSGCIVVDQVEKSISMSPNFIESLFRTKLVNKNIK